MRPVLLLAAALVLAGCSEAPSPDAEATTQATFDDLGLTAGATTGLIRGVVVDASIVPLAAATVTLSPGGVNVTTDDEGRFGYSDLQPGTYFLQASKLGYGTQQTSAEVVAGDETPAATMIRLDRLPGTEPYAVGLAWDGFMTCSATVAIAFATGCMVGDFTDDNSRRSDPIEAPPTFLQSELDWDTTQSLGSNLCMRHYAEGDADGTGMLMDDVCGPRPLMQQANASALAEGNVGNGNGIERVVWVDDAVTDTTFGLALNQKFTVYTFLFYNFEPAAGWTFLADGEPVPPA